MTSPPERIVPRQVVVYDRQRQCLAPGCGEWFAPTRETRIWCSAACRLAVYRARHVPHGTGNAFERESVSRCDDPAEEG
ncbi:MAG: hypothetical protein RIS45_1589 [Planctomycetota bacterium]|jgi:hypothetical protein